MVQSGSYDVNRFSTSSEGEIRRLNAQLDLFWEKEFALYTRIGLTDGMKILDCGSGPGYLSEKLLSLLPGSTLTTVEMNPSLVEVARERLSEYIKSGRCTVVENSILKMDLSENSFDFVITRLVVEHVPDPLAACRELFRVLKPQGIAVIIDNDFEMHVRTFPHIAELGDLYDAYCRARTAGGGNPKIGRELPVLLKKTGFSKVDMEIISAHSAVLGDGPFLKSEGPGIPTQLVETGYLAAETYQGLIAKWHDMLKNSDHAIVRQLYVASGRKGNLENTLQPKQSSLVHGEKTVTTKKNTTPAGIVNLKNEFQGGSTFEKIVDLVKQHVASLLGSASINTIKDDIALTDIGIDSELATDLQASLTAALEFEKPLPATLVFDYPTIQAIARFIVGRMDPSVLNGSVPSTSAPTTSSDIGNDIESLSNEEIERKLMEKLDNLDKE
jgi:ubiquinone/menaquinone biosynthesis C-methylase UbiE